MNLIYLSFNIKLDLVLQHSFVMHSFPTQRLSWFLCMTRWYLLYEGLLRTCPFCGTAARLLYANPTIASLYNWTQYQQLNKARVKELPKTIRRSCKTEISRHRQVAEIRRNLTAVGSLCGKTCGCEARHIHGGSIAQRWKTTPSCHIFRGAPTSVGEWIVLPFSTVTFRQQ